MGRPDRSLRGLLRDVGDGPLELPFRSAAQAYAWLGGDDRARVKRAREQIRAAWLKPRPEFALHDAVHIVDPESRLTLYPYAGPGGPQWIAQTFTSDVPTDEPIRSHDLLPSMRLYALDRRDRYSNRPVAVGPLVLHPPVAVENPAAFIDALLQPNDVLHQLRMILYEGECASLYVGLYRRPSQSKYDLASHARLLALRPALFEWSRTARAIGLAPLGDGALAAVLEQLERPALLVRGAHVVFANRAGAAYAQSTQSWARNPDRVPPPGVVTPIAPAGHALKLVIVHAPALSGLPPSLQPVLDLVAEGLTDKEIALRLDMPLATVRTYVTRGYKRLGVHDRRELIVQLRHPPHHARGGP